MPEVIRRQKEGVSGGPRANCRFSEGAWAAIKAAAERDGYDNPTKWVRDAATKAAGYEAPAEATPEVPWVVAEGEEPSSEIEKGEVPVPTTTLDPEEGDVGPASQKPRARTKKRARTPKPAQAPSVPEPGRGKTRAREASILELAKGALRRLLE